MKNKGVHSPPPPPRRLEFAEKRKKNESVNFKGKANMDRQTERVMFVCKGLNSLTTQM